MFEHVMHKNVCMYMYIRVGKIWVFQQKKSKNPGFLMGIWGFLGF